MDERVSLTPAVYGEAEAPGTSASATGSPGAGALVLRRMRETEAQLRRSEPRNVQLPTITTRSYSPSAPRPSAVEPRERRGPPGPAQLRYRRYNTRHLACEEYRRLLAPRGPAGLLHGAARP